MTKLINKKDEVFSYFAKTLDDRDCFTEMQTFGTDIFISQKPFFEIGDHGYINPLDVAVHVAISSFNIAKEDVLLATDVTVEMIISKLSVKSKKNKYKRNEADVLSSIQNLIDQDIINVYGAGNKINDIADVELYDSLNIIQPNTTLDGKEHKKYFWTMNTVIFNRLKSVDTLKEMANLFSVYATIATRQNNIAKLDRNITSLLDTMNKVIANVDNYKTIYEFKDVASYDTHDNIAEMTGMTKRTVVKIVKRLKELKAIVTVNVHLKDNQAHMLNTVYAKYENQLQLRTLLLASLTASRMKKTGYDHIEFFKAIDAISDDSEAIDELDFVEDNGSEFKEYFGLVVDEVEVNDEVEEVSVAEEKKGNVTSINKYLSKSEQERVSGDTVVVVEDDDDWD